MPPEPHDFRHLDFSNRARAQHYIARGGGGGEFPVVARRRAAHAEKLKRELLTAQAEEERRRIAGELAEYQEDTGIDIEVVGAAGMPLKLEPLDAPRFGIVLKNVRTIHVGQPDGTTKPATVATVFVKHGKLTHLIKRVEQYGADAERDHEAFVANVESIGLAAVEAFWTSKHPLPDLTTESWWEVWVRAGGGPEKRGLYEQAVLTEAHRHGMQVKPGKLILPEHTVLLIKTTRQRLAAASSMLNFVTELRYPALTPAHFVEKGAVEQNAIVEGLLRRIAAPVSAGPSVCVLDTGVNRGHPLLAGLLAENDQETTRPEWGKDDHHPSGHGTQMAGLAAYGDLTPLFANAEPVQLTHRLESVKILPRLGQNEPEHYGAITVEAMALAESKNPDRQGVYVLAITATDAPDFRETGKPSAWSAALDAFAAGYYEEDDVKRLICVSAGNVSLANAREYPNINDLTSIEDPAQSWNALTVGAYTDKDTILDENGGLMPDWTPLAPKGGLCPESCTAVLWSGRESRAWPIKPDVVFEGGNRGYDASGFASTFDSMSVLTTNADFQRRLLTSFSATSAATGLAANMAATIHSRNPTFWPETVRALIVHSAHWTPEMMRGVNPRDKSSVAYALRRFGYGVPNLGRALQSAHNRATLIAQDLLQPFEKREGRVVTRDMMLYRLPWPKALLQEYSDTEVRFRATLSYFIEPNPGSRIPNTKYRYAGCNLRFQVQTPTERRENFIARVSDAISAEERAGYETPDDTGDGWLIGDSLRRRGSIHSDSWTGTAANLAQIEHLLVYPVNGWWRLRPQHGRYAKRIRYSLVLTLETLGTELNIYAPIQAAIPISVEV